MQSQNRSSPSGPKSASKATAIKDGGVVTLATVALITMTVIGARTTDIVTAVNAQQKVGLITGNGRVTAQDTVEIQVSNPTAATITTGSVTYVLEISKYSA